MHDPDVVAWEIRRPWPRLERQRGGPRWSLLRRRRPAPGSVPEAEAIASGRDPFPWWKARGWIWLPILAGFRVRFPALVTVWHREPGGRDSGDVCPHYVRWQLPGGEWQHRMVHAWRWHVHHFRLQIHPWQRARRRLLTRCDWCAGRHSRRDPVNMAALSTRERAPWWRGERGLYHHDCAAVAHAHSACLCNRPVLQYGDWGRCRRCRGFRAFGVTMERLQRIRILAAVPAGERDPDAWATVQTLAALESGLPSPMPRPRPRRGLVALRHAVAQAAGRDWCIVCEQAHGPAGWTDDCIPEEAAADA